MLRRQAAVGRRPRRHRTPGTVLRSPHRPASGRLRRLRRN